MGVELQVQVNMYGACLLILAFQVLAVTEAVTPMIYLDDLDDPVRRSVMSDTLEKGPAKLLLGLGTGEHLRAAGQVNTSRGTAMLKLEETYQGLPVSGQWVVLEVGEGAKRKLRGRLVRGIIKDVPSIEPAITKEEALEKALRDNPGDNPMDVKFDPEKDAHLEVFVRGVGGSMKAKLVYKLSYRVETSRMISRPTFIIDANDGDILKKWDGISLASRRIFTGNFLRKSENLERSLTQLDELKRSLEATGELERSFERSQTYDRSLETYEKLKRLLERSNELRRSFEIPEKLERSSVRATEKLVSGIGGNSKTGEYWYGRGDNPPLEVLQYPNGTCTLINDFAEVYNCKGSYDCDHTTMSPHQFDCNQGNQDATNGAFSPLNDAFFHIGETFKMFREWYDVPMGALLPQNSYGGTKGDDNGDSKRCKARLHYGEEYENAFWDGETLAIGDGGPDRYPLTSLNMVAHELAHGATEARAGLIGSGQSGAINEAFSDIAAETAEYFSRKTTDWSMGYEDTKAPNASLRYFADPPRDGFSIGHYRDYCLGADSHAASGIFNKAFYTLANSPGWDIRKAFGVFFAANALYWHPDSQFHDAACDVKASACDLGYDVNDVARAFRSVGIEPCSALESKSLPGPVKMSNGTSMTFKIANHDIAVRELVFAVDTYSLLDMTVDTGGMKFEVKSPHGYLPPYFTLPTMSKCLGAKPCTVQLTALEDAQLSILAMSYLKAVVSEQSLGPEGSVEVSFTLPSSVVKANLRLAFLATVGSGGGIVYYVRHGSSPEVTSLKFDVMGRNDEMALMCKPKEGKYYVKVVPLPYSNEPVRDVQIKLYAVFDGKLIKEITPDELD